jgi:hypothetical protein
MVQGQLMGVARDVETDRCEVDGMEAAPSAGDMEAAAAAGAEMGVAGEPTVEQSSMAGAAGTVAGTSPHREGTAGCPEVGDRQRVQWAGPAGGDDGM